MESNGNAPCVTNHLHVSVAKRIKVISTSANIGIHPEFFKELEEDLLTWVDSLHGAGWPSPLTLGQCVWRFARLAQDSGRAVRR